MKSALYAGSFDPITVAHVDIVQRADKLFDKVAIGLANNFNKKYMFDFDTRKKMIEAAFNSFNMPEVEVVALPDMIVVDYAAQNNYSALIRGLRNTTDFNYESQIEQVNKQINSSIETVFLFSDPTLTCVSSSLVKELLHYNSQLAYDLVPVEVMKIIKKMKE